MDKIGIVVNYYRKSLAENRFYVLTLATELGLLMLKQSSLVGTVILVDGSPKPDKQIENSCSSLGIQYLHTGKELSIPEAYNFGWRSLSEPYIALMANDILAYDSNTITKLYDLLQLPDVGCVFPYLSEGDWKVQDSRFIEWFEKTCEPSFLLLNFIMLKRCVLEKVGGVDEGYKCGFYDPILLIKIRKLGYRVVLVGGTKMIHINSLTKIVGESTIDPSVVDIDQLKFKEEYSDYYYLPKGKTMNLDTGWPYKFWKWPFSSTLSIKILWWLTKHIPISIVRAAFTLITVWFEPILTRYPAKYGGSNRSSVDGE